MNLFRQILAVIALSVLANSLRNTVWAATGQSFEDAKHHWAYQSVRQPVLPKVKATKHVRSPIDAFLLAKLEEKNLTFAPPADKRTLLRRVYYDLIGLPPTFEEIREFERDGSSKAFEKVVDRLLASPRSAFSRSDGCSIKIRTTRLMTRLTRPRAAFWD